MAYERPQPDSNGLNRHTGKRAQRIERMREKLWEGIGLKNGKLDKDVLVAMKMLMELDGIASGVKTSEAMSKRERTPKRLKSVIKVPALLETA